VIINCLHGYFIVREETRGEAALFNSTFGQDLTKKNDYYTFSFLADAENYSLIAKPWLAVPATATYQGEIWEVMEQNGFVYNYISGAVVPINSITTRYEVTKLNDGYTSRFLLLPGSVDKDWNRVASYQCFANLRTLTFNYSELTYA
jgi:hypothetical protein